MTREPYARVPRSVIADSRLTLRDRLVYEALALFADRHGRCWPKRRQIAELTGVLPQHVTNTTSRLCRLGHLTKVGNGGRSRPAQYTLNLGQKGTSAGTLSDPKTQPSTFIGLEHQKGTGGGTVYDQKGTAAGTRSEQTTTKGTPAKEESLHGSELLPGIMSLYHDQLPELPTAKVASAQLAEDVHHLVGEIPAAASLGWWHGLFKEVRRSDFLLGKGDRGWKAKLPWLVKVENAGKVLNGMYRDGGGEDWTRGML